MKSKPVYLKDMPAYDVVSAVEDKVRDECLLTIRIEGVDIRRAAFGDDWMVDRLARAVDMVVGHKARQKWYATRPKPKLAAGTLGHARRRR